MIKVFPSRCPICGWKLHKSQSHTNFASDYLFCEKMSHYTIIISAKFKLITEQLRVDSVVITNDCVASKCMINSIADSINITLNSYFKYSEDNFKAIKVLL